MNADYNKSSLWKLIIVYLVIGVLVYGVVFYFVRAGAKNNLTVSGAVPTDNSVIPAVTRPSATPSPIDNSVLTTRTDPSKGQFLTTADGKTLYTFDSDTNGTSNCTGNCATIWPPYLAPNSAQSSLPLDVSTISRADGGPFQYTYKGKPLYLYSKDIVPGDITGDGFNGLWHIISVV
jgi:predicted lipoprotein with Yx(FWY)xxD motif